MQRRAYLTAVGSAAALGAAGCAGIGAGLTEEEYDVGMSVSAFQPAQFETTVGEPVVWGNTSSRGHTVTAYEGSLPEGADYFASGGYDSEAAAREAWQGRGGGIAPGETYEHTFETAGEFPYFCIPHEADRMVGVVTVTE